MTTLSASQVAAVALKAGFTGTNAIIAVAVSKAESGWRTDATNHNTNGSTDYGLWQINTVHSDLLKSGNWQDPQSNANMAHSVWASSGWGAWTVYKTGAYVPFLAQAQAGVAAANGGNISLPSTGTTAENVGIIGDTKAAIKVASILGEPAFWIRFGMFLIGGLLIILGIIGIAGTNPTVKKYAKQGAGLAAKAGIAAVAL